MDAALLIPWFELEPWVVHLPLGFGSIKIEPFVVFVLLASFVALLVALAFATRHRRSPDLTLSLALYLVLFGYPISYLFNGVLYSPDTFLYLLQHPAQAFEIRLGWSMYGGVLGAIAGAFVWKWRTGGSILGIGDGFAFATPYAWTLARVGCFLTHDHPGRVSEFPLAVASFRVGPPPYQPRHDLGLYDGIVFAMLGAMFLVLNRKPRAEGFYVAVLPILYAPSRFFLDFLRASAADGGDIRYVGLTPAQYGSVLLMIAGVLLACRTKGASRSGHT